MGYERVRRLVKPKAAAAREIKTNYSGLPTLHEVLAQLRVGQNDGPKP
jgi:hypothetical protein